MWCLYAGACSGVCAAQVKLIWLAAASVPPAVHLGCSHTSAVIWGFH